MFLSTLIALAVSASVQLHPDQPGVAIQLAPLGGFPLCIWNDSSLFRILKPAMQEANTHLFRFPNGSLSNEYHWNSTGQFDADSVWIASDSVWSHGFMGETRHRGTSKNSYGFLRPSLICDGDTSTYWWSQPDHPDAPGWFYVDFGASKAIDSIALWLGDLRPDSVQILKWTGSNGVYPGPHQQFTGWTEIARSAVAAHAEIKLSATSRYMAVRAIGNLAQGWQAKEFVAFKAGKAVTKNVNSQTSQTQVVATSAHSSIIQRVDYTSNWDFQGFMDWIHAYPGADPMICVNYGSGTAQEAAAWVHYANKTMGYGIRRWQIGNEMSGVWEEGGPVNARQYAIRFLKYAKAMKAIDPTISVYGPVYPSALFVEEASGNFDGRSWVEGFLRIVDSAEKQDAIRYLDGVDFHTYPYWFGTAPDRAAMLQATDGNGAQFDSLISLMTRSIAEPLSREILMTEYNTSTVNSSVEQEASAGTASGLQLAHFIKRFGNRGGAILWDLFEGGGQGPDGTVGTLGAFNKPARQNLSNLGYPPNGTFWPLRTIMREWLDPAGGDTIVSIDQSAGARLFAVSNHGQISVMAFNLGQDSTSISIDATPFSGGNLLSWGTGEYTWNGTGVEAFAFPNNGPSSRPVPAGWNGSFKVPPFGFVVIRAAGSRSGSARNVHVFADRQSLLADDTLNLSGWSIANTTTLSGGRWSVSSDIGGTLVATDGAWDGPMESWKATIPASMIGPGSWTLRLAVAVSGSDTLRDSIALQIEGSLRPVLLVSNFDKKTLVTGYSKRWFQFGVGDTGTTFSADIDSTTGLGSPYLHVETSIEQPSTLGYTNFVATAFQTTVPPVKDSTKNFAGLSFDYRATLSGPSQGLRIMAESSPVTDYNFHYLSLPTTDGQWVHKVVRLSDFHQDNWGKPTFALNPSLVKQIELRIDGEGAATLDLDNIYLLGTKGDAVGIRTNHSRGANGLSAHGRTLSVKTSGNWTLRLYTPDGRTSVREAGRDAAEIQLPKSSRPMWAVLESASGRHVLALSPIVK